MPRPDLLEAPALPEPVRLLVKRARGRLLLTETIHRSIALIGAAAGLAAVVVAVGRFVVLPWAEPVAAGLVIASLLAALVISLILRASPGKAALAVDRRLGGYDRVATALELANRADLGRADLGPEEVRQLQSAETWSHGRDLDGFGRIFPRGPLPLLAIGALLATLVMALVPSSADVALAQQRAEQQMIAEEIERLEEMAAEAPQEVRETLERLIEELAQAETLEQAISALGEGRQELAEQGDPAELARRTALAGLEQRLSQSPVSEGETAASATSQPRQLPPQRVRRRNAGGRFRAFGSSRRFGRGGPGAFGRPRRRGRFAHRGGRGTGSGWSGQLGPSIRGRPTRSGQRRGRSR